MRAKINTWISGVRSAMPAASQLPGKGPTDVDDAPAPEVNLISHYDYEKAPVAVYSVFIFALVVCGFFVIIDPRFVMKYSVSFLVLLSSR